jgi:hypothetical protein
MRKSREHKGDSRRIYHPSSPTPNPSFIKKENPLNEVRPFRFSLIVYLIIAFSAGAVLAGLFFYRQGSLRIRELDTRYAGELRSANETIGRLTEELGRERGINQELREHNSRAGELVEGLTDTALRNVRNLQDAVGLIGEIRKKLAVLEGFYADSRTGGGAP